MKKTAQGRQKASVKKLPALRIVGMAVIVSVLILMSVLLGLSYKGVSDSSPLLLIYGSEGRFPSAGFRTSINAAGFDYDLVSKTDSYEDGKLVIPDKYDDRDLVIMTVGDKGFNHVTAFASQSNVYGFVLVCPEFPGNASMEGINSRAPSKDIAVFAGRDDVRSVEDVSGARLIYERISGDDTVYGESISSGGLFPSDCYVSSEQNRYLSLSHFEIASGDRMLLSPIFQKELAEYLNLTYSSLVSDEIKESDITNWYSFAVFSIFAGIAAFCLYFISYPAALSKGEKNRISTITIPVRVYTVMFAASAASGMLAIILSRIGVTHSMVKYILLLTPLVVASVDMVIAIAKIGKVEGRPSMRQIAEMGFMTLTIIIYLILAFMLFTDLSVAAGYIIGLVVVAAILSSIIAGLISFERRHGSLAAGDTSRIIGIMCVSGLLALIGGLVLHDRTLTLWGAAALASTVLPAIVTVPVGRHSPSALAVAMVHGTAYLLIMLAIL